MSGLLKQAAARSAARSKKRVSPPPLQDPTPKPEGVIKETARGTRYRVLTIPLMDLPGFLEREGLEPKTYFYYPPESDWFLGVRKKGEEVKEL